MSSPAIWGISLSLALLEGSCKGITSTGQATRQFIGKHSDILDSLGLALCAAAILSTFAYILIHVLKSQLWF